MKAKLVVFGARVEAEVPFDTEEELFAHLTKYQGVVHRMDAPDMPEMKVLGIEGVDGKIKWLRAGAEPKERWVIITAPPPPLSLPTLKYPGALPVMLSEQTRWLFRGMQANLTDPLVYHSPRLLFSPVLKKEFILKNTGWLWANFLSHEFIPSGPTFWSQQANLIRITKPMPRIFFTCPHPDIRRGMLHDMIMGEMAKEALFDILDNVVQNYLRQLGWLPHPGPNPRYGLVSFIEDLRWTEHFSTRTLNLQGDYVITFY